MGARDFLALCLFAFVAVCVLGAFIALAMLVRTLAVAMIQVIPVRRTYLSIACDWPGCEERIDFPGGPDDEDRNITLLNAALALAWLTRYQDGESK